MHALVPFEDVALIRTKRSAARAFTSLDEDTHLLANDLPHSSHV